MPERTCICCRKKGEKDEFFRIAEQDGRYTYDEDMKIQSRGFYICKDIECVKRLSKNRKYNVELEELTKLLKKLEKRGKSLIDIIRPMKNSDFFIFGIDENISEIKKKKVKLLVLPKDINQKYIDQFMRLKEEYDIKILNIEKKEEFLNIFSRNVNVVGIINKKVAKGILTKMEVTE